jgi:curved DNA-binding protein CbpA
MTETFYDVLGVAPDVSTSDIEDAYRERIKETHPDLNDAENADEVTQRVIEARDVLTDEDERERYDRMGHDAYVGDAGSEPGSGDHDSGDSAAARAARDAGWGDADTSGPSESTAAGTNAGPSKRRRRERTASERVRDERRRTGRSQSNGPGRTVSSRSTGGSGPNRSQSTVGKTTAAGAASTDGGSESANATRSQAKREQIYDAGAWNASTGYNVRNDVSPGVHPLRRLFSGTSLSLTAITFVLYPVMLFSTVFPPFHLVVNFTVGLCTLLLIGYLQSQPSVGVLVFGGWSLLVPAALFVFQIDPTGIVGLLALAGAWFPFGLSVLTLSFLRL